METETKRPTRAELLDLIEASHSATERAALIATRSTATDDDKAAAGGAAIEAHGALMRAVYALDLEAE